MKKPDPRLYHARIEASQNVYDSHLRSSHAYLEDAVAGNFPEMLGGTPTPDASKRIARAESQFNLNLMLPAQQYMLALAYGLFPQLRFARKTDVPVKLAERVESMLEVVMDEGEAVAACRDAMRVSMTRGPWVVWLGIGEDRPSGSTLLASREGPADLIAAAAQGMEVHPPPGTDFGALSDTIRSLLADPNQALALTEQGRAALVALAQESDTLLSREMKGPHTPLRERRRLWYQPGIYGRDTLWDCSVRGRNRRAWVARRLVLSQEEFEADPIFTDEAKRALEMGLPTENEGYETVTFTSMTERDKFEENGRHTIWEVWDRIRWQRHYVAKGYEKFLETDDGEYPYMGADGRPIFFDFFPCAEVVPIEHNKDVPWGITGVAQLEPGLVAQMEAIKTSSAYLKACKQAGRYLLMGPGVDDGEMVEVAGAPDMSIFRPKKGLGEKAKDEVFMAEFRASDAPLDFLKARQMVVADFGTQTGITVPTLTGQPAADTLGQEQMAAAGATIRQADIVRAYEAGFGALAHKTLALVRAFMPEAQVKSLLGKDVDMPITDENTGMPIVLGKDEKTGEPVYLTPWLQWATSDLLSRKIQCRFASSVKQEDAVRLKQLMDFAALNNTTLDAMGMRYFDARPILQEAARGLDADVLEENKPSAGEIAMRLKMMEQPGGGEGDGGEPSGGSKPEQPGGGDASGRKAGGQRGAPAMPGRQSRDRGPQTRGNQDGAANRARSALS